jgi:hypothetical protein
MVSPDRGRRTGPRRPLDGHTPVGTATCRRKRVLLKLAQACAKGQSGGAGPPGGYVVVDLTAMTFLPLVTMILADQDANVRNMTRSTPPLPNPSLAPPPASLGPSRARIPTVPWTRRT